MVVSTRICNNEGLLLPLAAAVGKSPRARVSSNPQNTNFFYSMFASKADIHLKNLEHSISAPQGVN